jgi:hypothetical protein
VAREEPSPREAPSLWRGYAQSGSAVIAYRDDGVIKVTQAHGLMESPNLTIP